MKRLLLKLSVPFRWMIRHELWDYGQRVEHNISAERQRIALRETAEYVNRHLAHLESCASPLELLSKALQHVQRRDGLFLEFGVFSGQTINHLAAQIDGQIFGFDSFEGLPERWRDGLGAGFFKVDKLPSVRQNVVLIKGWFEQTLPDFLQQHSEPVAFLHVDCDLYSSTKTVFQHLAARIEPGTVIVFDEYFNYPGWKEGEFKAFQEFITATRSTYEYLGYNRFAHQVGVKITGKVT